MLSVVCFFMMGIRETEWPMGDDGMARKLRRDGDKVILVEIE